MSPMRVPAVPIRFFGLVVALAVAALVLTPVTASGASPSGAARSMTVPAGCLHADLAPAVGCKGRAAGQAAHIVALARAAMKRDDLRAVILSVWDGDRQIARAALGQSITSQPATTAMHFRIGAIAIPYLAILLLQLVDHKRVSLDDPLSKWFPRLRAARRITLADLIESRSGYYDYEKSPKLVKKLYANPFRYFSQQYLIHLGVSHRLVNKPGNGFNYAHTNFVILGHVLQKITGKPLAQLIKTDILTPLGLSNTNSPVTPAIRPPVLEAYDSERGVYEDSTYWNPSWSLAAGAIMTSDITDVARTAIAVGSGTLLSRASYRLMIKPRSLLTPPGAPKIYYGMGVVLDNSWVLQNPLFAGYNATMAYLPSKKITIAVATTLGPKASPSTNYSTQLTAAIGKYLAPQRPPFP
jgi:D-alanyl-D-alanine carboxypeptidase